MKKFDLTVPITDLEGKELKDEKGEAFTFAKAIGMACITPSEGDTPEKKYNDFTIGVKIVNNPTAVDFSKNEISRLKEKVGVLYGPIVVGRVWNLLEGK